MHRSYFKSSAHIFEKLTLLGYGHTYFTGTLINWLTTCGDSGGDRCSLSCRFYCLGGGFHSRRSPRLCSSDCWLICGPYGWFRRCLCNFSGCGLVHGSPCGHYPGRLWRCDGMTFLGPDTIQTEVTTLFTCVEFIIIASTATIQESATGAIDVIKIPHGQVVNAVSRILALLALICMNTVADIAYTGLEGDRLCQIITVPWASIKKHVVRLDQDQIKFKQTKVSS